MKLIATKTGTAGEMMLNEKNPYPKHLPSNMGVVHNYLHDKWTGFHMLTDDPTLQEGQEVDREEYEVQDQFFDPLFDNWFDSSGYSHRNNYEYRQILRRKAVVLTDKIGHINCDPEALKNPAFVNAMNKMAELAYEKAECSIEQAKINVKVLFRQCGIRRETAGNILINEKDLINWFSKGLHKKDYNIYDTI